MRSAVIHGVLLAVMLVYGYRTWTRDKTVKPNLGDVVLWNKTEADLVSFDYKNDKFKKHLVLERRGQGEAAYWWATETTIDKKIKPPEPKKDAGSGSGSGSGSAAGSAAGSGSAAAGSGSGSAAAGSGSAVAKKPDDKKPAAGSGSAAAAGSAGSAAAGSAAAGSGSAVANKGSAAGSAAGSGSGSAVAQAGSGSGSAGSAAEPPVVEETKKVREYPLGDAGDKLVQSYVKARALRDLGVADPDMKKKYKLDEAKGTLVVTFKDGKRTFKVADSQFNDNVRYAIDDSNGHAYVLSKDMVSGFEVGEPTIHLVDPRGFEAAKVESIVLEGASKTKVAKRVQSGVEGTQVKTWGDAETGKPNQALANFVDNLNTLRPTDYEPKLDPASLTKVLTATFKDGSGAKLGTMALYKGEKPGELPEGQELDPANPPKGQTVYYIVTEKTHVPAVVRTDTAQRAENDLANLTSDKPVPGDGKSVDPKGNPFGKGPLPKLGGSGGSATPPPAPGSGALQLPPKNP